MSMVVSGCLERRKGSSRYGRFGILATDGASVWAASVDDKDHKADNLSCRKLSRQAWVERIMATLEAGESSTSGSAGAAAVDALEVVVRGDPRSAEASARLRVADVLRPDQGTDAEPPAQPSSSYTASGTATGRRVYLSTFVPLVRLAAGDAARVLRVLCGTRLALANKTARAVKERQSQLETDATRAASLAGETSARASAERRALMATAVALVNAKKERLAELSSRAEEAERQLKEYEDERKGLERLVAGLRAEVKRGVEREERLGARLAEGAGVPSPAGEPVVRAGVAREAERRAEAVPLRARKRARGASAQVAAEDSDTDPDQADLSDVGSDGGGESEGSSSEEDELEGGAPAKRTKGAAADGATGAMTHADSDSDDIDCRNEPAGATAVHGALAALARRRRDRGSAGAGGGLASPAALRQASRLSRQSSRASSEDSLR